MYQQQSPLGQIYNLPWQRCCPFCSSCMLQSQAPKTLYKDCSGKELSNFLSHKVLAI
jgi:hypothetical protein